MGWNHQPVHHLSVNLKQRVWINRGFVAYTQKKDSLLRPFGPGDSFDKRYQKGDIGDVAHEFVSALHGEDRLWFFCPGFGWRLVTAGAHFRPGSSIFLSSGSSPALAGSISLDFWMWKLCASVPVSRHKKGAKTSEIPEKSGPNGTIIFRHGDEWLRNFGGEQHSSPNLVIASSVGGSRANYHFRGRHQVFKYNAK